MQSEVGGWSSESCVADLTGADSWQCRRRRRREDRGLGRKNISKTRCARNRLSQCLVVFRRPRCLSQSMALIALLIDRMTKDEETKARSPDDSSPKALYLRSCSSGANRGMQGIASGRGKENPKGNYAGRNHKLMKKRNRKS